MRKALATSVAALTAVSAVAFSTSAAAYDYRDNNDNEVGAAIIGGVLGFVLGTAVSSGSNRYGSYGSSGYGYGSRPYYGGSYGSPYGSPYGYGYGSSPYSGGSYGYGSPYGYGGSPYYGGSYGGYGYNNYGYGYGCRTQRVWDRYYGRYVTRQVC